MMCISSFLIHKLWILEWSNTISSINYFVYAAIGGFKNRPDLLICVISAHRLAVGQGSLSTLVRTAQVSERVYVSGLITTTLSNCTCTASSSTSETVLYYPIYNAIPTYTLREFENWCVSICHRIMVQKFTWKSSKH